MDLLYAVFIKFLELVRKKEVKCNNNQLPEVSMAPEIKKKLSKTEQLIMRDLLRQMNVIKDTIKSKHWLENSLRDRCIWETLKSQKVDKE